jgi:uncharacterized protein (TIGR00730 family)
LEATAAKLQEEGVDATILFFGSARALSKSDLDTQRSNIAAQLEKQPDTESLQMRLQQLQRLEWMCGMYETVAELAERLTLWSQQGDAALSLQHSIIGVTREHPSQSDMRTEAQTHATTKKQRLYVCTGGGPGLMAAANEGAGRVAGARSIGMGISLPHERGLNSFTSDDLAFEFHYFFTRKFWMAYHCEALVAVPGGFGTLDELFEVLTLRQTGKMQRDLPVVLLGTHYWTTIVNWQVVTVHGTTTLVRCS